MRDRLMILLLVPLLLFPIVVISSGGDLEIVWSELSHLLEHGFVARVYAQAGSPPVMPTGPVMPSGPVIPAAPLPAGAPVLTNWGMISAAILLAVIGLFAMRSRFARSE